MEYTHALVALAVSAVTATVYFANCLRNYIDRLDIEQKRVAAHNQLISEQLASLSDSLHKFLTRSPKAYEDVLAMLEEQQGEWYVEKIVSHELAKILKFNTKDLDSPSAGESDDSEESANDDSDAESGDEESDAESDTENEESVAESDTEHEDNTVFDL